MKIAHSIVLDGQAERMLIDGVAFPFYTKEDPEIELIRLGHGSTDIGAVHVGILADNITVISKSGKIHTPVTASTEVELAWARARAKEIVHEGLAPIIEWIGKGMPK